MSRLNPVKGVAMRRPQAGAGSRKPGGAPRAGQSGAEGGYLYLAGIRDASNRIPEYRTDSDVCPICQTDRQFNKNLRILVSPCYHKMCESCIDRLFTLGPEPCPQCGRILRKINFAHQTFEDLKVEKEVAVRRRINDQYNKRREDFDSDKAYDDYLEEVEDITFNLLNDIDIDKTEARIADFANKNASLLARNKEKQALELLAGNERDEMEKQAREERRQMIEEHDRFEEAEGAKVKAEIVEALARGASQVAKDIQRRYAEAKAAREKQLAGAIPPSLAALLTRDAPPPASDDSHPPTSPSYTGPYIPFAYSDPALADWVNWYTLLDDYVDPRPNVVDVKCDRDLRYTAGGYNLKEYWDMEIRSAVQGLGIKPLSS